MSRASTGHIRKLKSGALSSSFHLSGWGPPTGPQHLHDEKRCERLACPASLRCESGQWSLTQATMPVSFRDYSEEWLKHRKVRGRPLADRTLAGYQDLLDRLILPTFGHHFVHTISRDLVDNWYDRLPSHTPSIKHGPMRWCGRS
jgi:Phage integrase, N-terminal SAM-like domain